MDAPADLDHLPVSFEKNEMLVSKSRLYRPSATLEGRRVFELTFPERPSDPLPFFAFHSAKGGVGRTTMAITLARHLAHDRLKKPGLLVDADFEAPGLSYLLAARKPETAISFEDMLVLAHADPNEDLRGTLDFVADRLQEHRVDELFVMPARRTMAALSAFAIRPEHIVGARKGRPFLIVDMLREIGARLGCGAVFVDLRAGLVEIAIQILTDPSVERVFVTTTSGQSLQATCGMLAALGDVQRATGIKGRKPLMVVNQVPAFLIPDRRFVDDITGEIEAAAIEAFQATAQQTSAERSSRVEETVSSEVEYGGDSPLAFAVLPHTIDLVRMARDWDSFITQLQGSGFVNAVINQVGSWSALDTLSRRNTGDGTSQRITATSQSLRQEACRKLAQTTRSMIVAETAEERLSTPLVTPPLRRLSEEFQKQPPIAVIEGAKGTGKTLTFRFLMEQETWSQAVRKLDNAVSPAFVGPTVPVHSSIAGRMIDLIGERTRAVAQNYSTGDPMRLSELRRRIQECLLENRTEAQWSDLWLDAIAWMSGVAVGTVGAWSGFLALAKDRKDHPIAMFEGLEEVISDPYADGKQAVALRALILDVPLRLRQEQGRPVGLLVFVRGDMVEAVIRQNLAQFRASYRNFALTWSSTDILELVVWLVSNSGAIPDLWGPAWRDKARAKDLERIWGWKLGTEKSREARSTEWVLAVLTDLNGRLTARDLVRFLAVAADLSINEEPADTRLLAPGAMRRAVASTSEEKVKEYPSEVTVLQPVFDRLRKSKGLETPLDLQTAYTAGLSDADLANLVKYGVFFEENGLYEVPELFRIGLGLTRKGARPNIISLTRRALEKAVASN